MSTDIRARSRKGYLALGAAALASAGLPAAVTSSASAAPAHAPGGDDGWTSSLGGFHSAPLPPKGFDPLTASNAELEHYAYPPRPAGRGAKYRDWLQLVTSKRVGVVLRNPPASELSLLRSHGLLAGTTRSSASQGARGVASSRVTPRTVSPTSTCTSPNWAGVVDTSFPSPTCDNYGSNESDFISEANADYNIPGVVSEGYNTLASDWVGIGYGTSTDPLIQAGSVSIWEENIPPAHPDYWFFAEVVPGLDIKEVNLAGLGAPQPNYTARITVEYQSSTVAAMNIEYDDNGTWYSGGLTFGVGGQGGASTAEYIVEDPCILSELWALSEYGVVPFWDADYTYKSNLESATSGAGPGGSLVAMNMIDKAGGIVSLTNFPGSGYPFEVIREGSADAQMGTCPNPL